MPLLETANRIAVCSVVAVETGVVAVEVQVASVSAVYRRTPQVAVRAHIVERPIAVVSVPTYRLNGCLIPRVFFKTEDEKPLSRKYLTDPAGKKAIGLTLAHSPRP